MEESPQLESEVMDAFVFAGALMASRGDPRMLLAS
jgi:hypothetical protein